ncbi:MAG: OmpA family protein [Candidatus Cyclobacteriaceae bacterium M2_1C_046]
MKLLTILFVFAALSPVYAQSVELINTVYNEENPILSPDGERLYFTRASHPQNIDGERDPGDIWFSEKQENGIWGVPQHGGDVINSRGWNGVLGFNADGSVIYLHNHYTDKSRPKTQGIAYSKKVGTQWSDPVNIAIPYFRNVSAHQSGWLSEDENILLMSFEGFYTRGAEDIYVILRNADGSWREPVNLGNTINTPYQEFTPYYRSEDSTLYFSSNGREAGPGSSDVFFSRRLDNTWTKWSAPVPLGDSINSQGREIGFINYPDRNQSVYSSTKNSDGYGDIKIHQYGKLPESEESELILFVVNERTGDRLVADVVLIDSLSKDYPVKVDVSGFNLSEYAKGPYTIQAAAPGFLPGEEGFILGDDAEAIIISLKPIEKGTRVVLEDVLFEQSRARLLPQSYDELNQVVKLMKDNPDLKIRLEGHTDTRGSQKANLKLSKMRVEAVKDYLVEQGISKRRIKGKGYGGSRPLFTDDSEENRMKNRRVEFVIVE